MVWVVHVCSIVDVYVVCRVPDVFDVSVMWCAFGVFGFMCGGFMICHLVYT